MQALPFPAESKPEAKRACLFILVCAILLAALSSCGASVVTEPFLNALALVESGGRDTATGDGGRARGPFQIWRGTWNDVNKTQGWRVPYETGATNRTQARLYARAHLLRLERQLAATLPIAPTVEQLYAAWNLGFSGFQRRGFDLSRCPQITRRAASKLNQNL